jgi:peptidoglycan hydrolase CwlO-like protein
MTNPTRSVSSVVQRIAPCLLGAALLMDIGCVSQRAYEQIKAETAEQTQALATVREEVGELDQQISGLQAANDREGAIIGELHATIQREQELLPVMRQEAEEQLSSLKTQVAGLLDQSWHLARKIADIRHESTSLQAMATQYKQDMEQAQAQAPLLIASHSNKPSTTDPTTTEEPPALELQPVEEIEPPQVAQAVSPAPDVAPVAPSTPPSSVDVEPPPANDSWFAMIISWLLAFWNWLFS